MQDAQRIARSKSPAGIDRHAAEIARAAQGTAGIDRDRAGQRTIDDQFTLAIVVGPE